MSEKSKLAKGALGTTESVIMGVSGTAPAFSAAATTTALIAAVGIHSPSSVLFCGLIMFGVTFSFMYLNRISPDAGAAYTWVSSIFGKTLGFFAGWSLLVASSLFMVSGTIPVSTSTLALISPNLTSNPFWVALVASGWLTVISAVILKGIKPTSYLQVLFTSIEVGILVIIIIAAFYHYAKQPAHILSFATFNPFNFSIDLFARGALISLFFFWGWDVTLNLTEETKNSSRTPGLAALLSMIIVTLLFVAFIMCALIALTDQEIEKSGTNVMLQISNKILPSPWGNIALIAVILSSLGTIETSILQFTRTLFAKSRDGALHERWGKIHPIWQTPWMATLLIWSLGMVFLVISSLQPTVSTIIDTSINVISFQVAFYYSLCGFACAWYYHKLVGKGILKKILFIIWPCISAMTLILIDIYGTLYVFNRQSIILGIGGICIGAIPYFLNQRKKCGS